MSMLLQMLKATLPADLTVTLSHRPAPHTSLSTCLLSLTRELGARTRQAEEEGGGKEAQSHVSVLASQSDLSIADLMHAIN